MKQTCGRIVFQAQINVFGDAESEATSAGKVFLLQFVFLHFQAAIQNFVGLESTDLQSHQVISYLAYSIRKLTVT